MLEAFCTNNGHVQRIDAYCYTRLDSVTNVAARYAHNRLLIVANCLV